MDCNITCNNNVFIRIIVIATHQSQYLASMHLLPPLLCLPTHSGVLCSCSLLCRKPLDESSLHSATNKQMTKLRLEQRDDCSHPRHARRRSREPELKLGEDS